ncbi:hypothetical protein HPB48_020243 [Haemaphysalis longicornis]|uniref:Ionotropic receptor n=1 Tax=Haemaphysalis longicornis TaxID=44386 RepID=A0A9J6H0G5_HAELO|nr:hypothetical protein HPB48_020243 [Haemaphysalis longicornis]
MPASTLFFDNHSQRTVSSKNYLSETEAVLIPASAATNWSGCLKKTAEEFLAAYPLVWILFSADRRAHQMRAHLLRTQDPSLWESSCYKRTRMDAQSGQFVSSLRGKKLEVGCSWAVQGTVVSSCEIFVFKFLIEMLVRMNVSVHLKFLDRRHDVYRQVDVFMAPVLLDEGDFSSYFFPGIVIYNYMTFYSHVGEIENLPVSALLTSSWLCLVALAISLLASATVMVLADIIEFKAKFVHRSCDAVLFLTASFLATSADTPSNRRFAWTRRKVYCFWLLGLLPFSVYVRSHFVSQLSFKRAVDPLDTLEKLDNALDDSVVLPCVISDTRMHKMLSDAIHPHSLLRNLAASFNKNAAASRLVVPTFYDCMQCASRKDRVCLAGHQHPLHVEHINPKLIESKEPLFFYYGTTVTRKCFALRQPYQNFLQRLLERGFLSLWSNNDPKIRLSTQMSEGTASGQLQEYKNFLYFFLLCLGFATCVFGAEVAFRGVDHISK